MVRLPFAISHFSCSCNLLDPCVVTDRVSDLFNIRYPARYSVVVNDITKELTLFFLLNPFTSFSVVVTNI